MGLNNIDKLRAANERIAALESQLAEANTRAAQRGADVVWLSKENERIRNEREQAEAEVVRLTNVLTRIRDERGVRPYDIAREALRPDRGAAESEGKE